MPLESPVLVMADQVLDARVFLLQIAHQADIGLELLVGEVIHAVGAADILHTDGAVVQADDVPRHPGLGHEPVDGAVAVDKKLDRYIDLPGSGQFLAVRAQDLTVEQLPTAVEGIDRRPVDDDDLRLDLDVVDTQAVVLGDVGLGRLDALLGEGNRFVHDGHFFTFCARDRRGGKGDAEKEAVGEPRDCRRRGTPRV